MKVGILGGGQLARMLALAGMPLGIEFAYIEQSQTQSVQDLGPLTVASFDDREAVLAFAKTVDVVTYESENIPRQTLEWLLEQGHAVHPGLDSLVTAQNRYNEKTCFDRLDIPTVDYHLVATPADLQQAAEKLGFPFILKVVSGGYDGKGQYRLHQADDLQAIQFADGVVYLAEQWLAFDYEVSCVAVRSQQDDVRFYDLCLNTHVDGILVKTAPANDAVLAEVAQDYTQRLMREFHHVGVLTVEYFVKDGQLYANEIAPRVHNTGHWTIDAAQCSQFENHIRAICSLPLGDTKCTQHYVMGNVIGEWPIDRELWLQVNGLHLHDYMKTARTGRKLGHITVTGTDCRLPDGFPHV